MVMEQGRRSQWWKPVVIVAAVVLAGIIGMRDLGLMLSAQGRCVVAAEPVVLLGFAPSLTADIDCSVSGSGL